MNAREIIREQILKECKACSEGLIWPEQATFNIIQLIERDTDLSATQDVGTKEFLKQMHFKQMCGMKV